MFAVTHFDAKLNVPLSFEFSITMEKLIRGNRNALKNIWKMKVTFLNFGQRIFLLTVEVV